VGAAPCEEVVVEGVLAETVQVDFAVCVAGEHQDGNMGGNGLKPKFVEGIVRLGAGDAVHGFTLQYFVPRD
jgi:hypothetical protein